ncbi:MAG: hypothetical protein ACFNLZ_02715 [Haemophilus parainfluenzae]|jgi:hypothetical protein|uniref:hypothetical protein n=1 Tax=Haemophilus sp. CCUG 60358 TaxID=1859695 RepID=UPI0008035AC9|nr:hypothetical protein [Haemophilus sp. CCUG 60358]MBF1222097.1 hypothetical protein [Haemophilus influenzae]OBX89252.1 hypothetical protein A9500_06720 [Haemophilus sp. CCUG 60358]
MKPKPTNPIAQLEQWKKNNEQAKINKFVNEMNQSKIGLVKGNKLNIEPVKSAVKLKFEKNQNANLHSVENTQGNEHSAPKAKYQGKLSFNPLVFEYTQISRQFKLIHDSNRKCLEVYPDEFHHKVKFRNELADLVGKLKAGSKLLNEMAKSQGVEIKDKYGALKGFNQANNYLIHKFVEVIEQIEQLQVENIEKQKLIVSEGK